MRIRWPDWRKVAGEVRSAPPWRDRVWLVLVVVGLLANLALYGYVWGVLPTLPAFLPLRYNAVGGVDEIGARTGMFRMPAIGTIVLLTNTILGAVLHPRERLAALFLAGSVPAVVALLFLATINIVRLAFGE